MGERGILGDVDAPLGFEEAWNVVFAKGRLTRRDVPLGFDPHAFSLEAYDEVVPYVAGFEQVAAQAPATRSGLRWRYEGESVLFRHERILNAGYDELVERVDIAGGIRLMNDYIGGSTYVVSRDSAGRIERQAERNLYLPQPNWMAFSGGQYIDVCKLERLHHAEDSCRISWRTIASPNGSAVHDDGSIAFERVDATRTRVAVCGLQLFTLPPLWAAAEPWLTGPVKDALVEESYRRFFTATLDNVEAAFEGRDHRTGSEPGATLSWADTIGQLVQLAKAALPEDPLAELGRRLREQGRPEPDLVDANGFRHFSVVPTQPVREPGWVAALRSWQEELVEVIEADGGRGR